MAHSSQQSRLAEKHGPGPMCSPQAPEPFLHITSNKVSACTSGERKVQTSHHLAKLPLLTQPIRPVLDFPYRRYIDQPQAERHCDQP